MKLEGLKQWSWYKTCYVSLRLLQALGWILVLRFDNAREQLLWAWIYIRYPQHQIKWVLSALEIACKEAIVRRTKSK